jgi:hypothetical protein
MTRSFEDTLALFTDAKRSGKTYKATCPAHADEIRSLSISRAKDGANAVFNCMAGCSLRELLEAKPELRYPARSASPVPDSDAEKTSGKHTFTMAFDCVERLCTVHGVRLGTNAKRVFSRIQRNSIRQKPKHCAGRTLAADLGISRSTVNAALKQLRDARMLTSEQTRRKHGIIGVSAYVCMPLDLIVDDDTAATWEPAGRLRRANWSQRLARLTLPQIEALCGAPDAEAECADVAAAHDVDDGDMVREVRVIGTRHGMAQI